MKEEIEALVPDFYDWPNRWMGVPEDEAYGQRVLKYFEPFVFEIVTGHLTNKTKKRSTLSICGLLEEKSSARYRLMRIIRSTRRSCSWSASAWMVGHIADTFDLSRTSILMIPVAVSSISL
jgi:hypothetical protein